METKRYHSRGAFFLLTRQDGKRHISVRLEDEPDGPVWRYGVAESGTNQRPFTAVYPGLSPDSFPEDGSLPGPGTHADAAGALETCINALAEYREKKAYSAMVACRLLESHFDYLPEGD